MRSMRRPGRSKGMPIAWYSSAIQPPTGLLVELVSREIQPYVEAWWAGG